MKSQTAVQLCELCHAGPRGIGGHEKLDSVGFEGGNTDIATFECTACHATWRRKYRGNGFFEWYLWADLQ